MDSVSFMKMIFDGYVRSFRRMNWGHYGTYTDWTTSDLVFFKDLGNALGFQSVQEWQHIDLCWLTEKRETFLYLERETENGNSPRTIEKLISEAPNCTPAPEIIVGLFAWLLPERFGQIVKDIQGTVGKKNMLLIASVGETKDSAYELEGRVFGAGKIWKRQAFADRDKGEYWYAYHRENTGWELVG